MLPGLVQTWRRHPTKQQLYGHLLPITKTIKVSRTRHAGHCWRSRDELISDDLLWTPSHSQAKTGWPAQTYIQQLCEDTGCSPEDLPEVMNDREEWRERVRDIRAGGMTSWWWNSFKIALLINHDFSSIVIKERVICIFVRIPIAFRYKVKLSPLLEGDPKAPFSIATTPKCRRGHYSFPWIVPLYPCYVLYIAEC